MTLQADLRALLLSDAAVAAACGGRAYWGEAPQGSPYPLITVNRVSLLATRTFTDRVALQQTRAQVDSWGLTYGDAAACADAVLGLLESYSGTVGGTRFQGVFLEGLRDSRADNPGDESGLFRVSADYMINHEES